VTSVQLSTSDGHQLEADVADPDGPVTGAVVVCHPHPLYGGNRFNPVVDTLFRSLPEIGCRCLRFDFRAEHGGGVDERLDLVAAIDHLDQSDSGRIIVAGYSFGANIALTTVDQRITALVAIAPPLSLMPAVAVTCPVLVLVPRDDQFCDPVQAKPAIEDWPLAELDIVESADHFLAGQSQNVASRSADWISALLQA
jgi:alpha/beta superfamily hydrolase